MTIEQRTRAMGCVETIALTSRLGIRIERHTATGCERTATGCERTATGCERTATLMLLESIKDTVLAGYREVNPRDS